MRRQNVVALLHALSGAAAMVASVATRGGMPVRAGILKPLGFAIFGAGMLLFAVAVAYCGRAFLGEVEPVTDRLVTGGPYRFVRHPVYLGMLVATLGITLGLGSICGLLLAAFVFLPMALWRARLEEAALAQRFGRVWEAYAARTCAIVPGVY
jgi:protein-S-isoprenylcysteine O-methyltransferase Ste14